jgi:drug/metabolite transporter (DMT)-like permease
MQPVLVALLSPAVLRERIAPSTWTALALGVCGAFVIVGPGVGTGAVPVVGVLLGLTSALASAFAQMWVRKATASDPPERVVFHFAALVSVLSAGAGLAGLGHVPELPLRTWVMLSLGMAGLGTLGQVLMTHAYSQGRAAPVSVVAYVGIVLSLGADFLVFGVAPGLVAAAGALLVLGAGVALVRGR